MIQELRSDCVHLSNKYAKIVIPSARFLNQINKIRETRTLDLPFCRCKHIPSLKNLPSPAPNESLPYWFQDNFAASFVFNFCLREFLLSAFANRFELRCEPRRLMLLYYKICPCSSEATSAIIVSPVIRRKNLSKYNDIPLAISNVVALPSTQKQSGKIVPLRLMRTSRS